MLPCEQCWRVAGDHSAFPTYKLPGLARSGPARSTRLLSPQRRTYHALSGLFLLKAFKWINGPTGGTSWASGQPVAPGALAWPVRPVSGSAMHYRKSPARQHHSAV